MKTQETKPLLLDLFSGAGGCAKGYADAGFQVIGCDLAAQKHYPYEFYQDDAMQVLQTLVDGGNWHGYRLSDFAVIHASPPCQEYSTTKSMRKITKTDNVRLALLEPLYTLLRCSGVPWVIENVVGAPMADAIELSGFDFGLLTLRRRWFASSEMLFSPSPRPHPKGFYAVVGGAVRGYGAFTGTATYTRSDGRIAKRSQKYRKVDAQAAMGIDWMTIKEMCEAVPPAYTRWIGAQLLRVLEIAA